MLKIEEILALLTTKFQGARKDGLEQLAAAISLQCQTIDQAQAIVDAFSEDAVNGFITNWRKKTDAEITKATTAREKSLKEKYDFIEKNKPQGEPAGNGAEPSKPEGITLEAIGKLIEERMEGVMKTISAKEAAKDYRSTFEKAITDAGVKGRQRDMMLRNFDRANTFATPEDFNAYLEEAKGDIQAIAQEQADTSLAGQGKPIYGAVNADGVSKGVADFIAAQQATDKLGGKEI